MSGSLCVRLYVYFRMPIYLSIYLSIYLYLYRLLRMLQLASVKRPGAAPPEAVPATPRSLLQRKWDRAGGEAGLSGNAPRNIEWAMALLV